MLVGHQELLCWGTGLSCGRVMSTVTVHLCDPRREVSSHRMSYYMNGPEIGVV